MKYLTTAQAAEKWNMTPKRVQTLCREGRIAGARRIDRVWAIPEHAEPPAAAARGTAGKKRRVNAQIPIQRVWAMPNKNTFDIPPIRELIGSEMTDGLWIDPFANRNKLASVTNDLSTAYDTDYHMDALDFMRLFESGSVDGVLYDPPYSPRQVSECYQQVGYNVTWDTTKASFWGNHKREISRIVKLGGKVITFGWNSGGIGYKYGFEIKRILLVPHGGWHNDTICTVEVKTHQGDLTRSKGDTSEMTQDTSRQRSLTAEDAKLIAALRALPENYWDFKDDDTREYTHGIHNYPAMMVCPISRNLIRLVKQVRPVGTLLDPFAGSGTVLVEGMLAGIPRVWGSDINPFALFLSKVKTTRLDMAALRREEQALLRRIQQRYEKSARWIEGADDAMRETYQLDLTAKDQWGAEAPKYLKQYRDSCSLAIEIPHFKNIGYWFKPRVILLLSLLKSEIAGIGDKDIRDFVFAAFSETIRLVSNRRNGEFKMFRMPPSKVEAFAPDVIGEFTEILRRNVEKMADFDGACRSADGASSVRIYQNNAAELPDIPDGSVDLVITSPPYGDSRTTVAYGEYSRLSLQWLDLFSLSEKEIMGIDRSLMGGSKYRNGFAYTIPSEILRQSLERLKDKDLERAGDVYSFYSDLAAAIAAVARKTTSGGYQFWVVGNRTVKGELLLTDQIIAEIAGSCGMEHIYTVGRNIINKVMPSMNSPTNESGVTSTTMNNEYIVILRKR